MARPIILAPLPVHATLSEQWRSEFKAAVIARFKSEQSPKTGKGGGLVWRIAPGKKARRRRKAKAPTPDQLRQAMRAEMNAIFYGSSPQGGAAWQLKEMSRRVLEAEISATIASGRELFESIFSRNT
jgi:hypothetical protein